MMRGATRIVAEAREVTVDGRLIKSTRVMAVDADGRRSQIAGKENDSGH